MRESRIIALMIALAVIQVVLIFGGILQPLSVDSLGNTLFLLARIVIIAYTGWIFSKSGFKEAAIKGGIVTISAVITLFLAIFIGMTVHKPVLGIAFPSQLFLLFYLFIIAIFNVLFGAIIAMIGALIGRKFRK